MSGEIVCQDPTICGKVSLKMEKKNACFSFSAISAFQNCPKSYEFKYILNQPEAFKSVETHMGRQVHEILKWAYEQKKNSGEPDLDTAIKEYKEKFWQPDELKSIRVIKPDLTLDYYSQQGEAYITSYFSRILSKDESETLALELAFEIDLDESIKYRGIIDRIGKGVDGRIRITDFKTGRVSDPKDNLQLPSYALFVFSHYPEQEVELCLEDLKEERTLNCLCLRRESTDIQKKLMTEIGMVTTTKLFMPRPSSLCDWCGYNNVCLGRSESISIWEPAMGSESGAETEAKRYCPECGSELKEKNGKYGQFLGCANFPRCRYTLDLKADSKNPVNIAQAKGEEICPECGSLLKKRTGKFGEFWGCSGYPDCRFTRKIKV